MSEPQGAAEPLPRRLRPMLAVAGPLPLGPRWAYEFKWDGVRALLAVERGEVRVTSRLGNDVTVSYPELAEVAGALADSPALLDGEIVALDATGRPDFAALQRRMHVGDAADARRLGARTPVSFLAFDVLHVAGRSTRELPYAERRGRLTQLLADGARQAVPPSFPTGGAAVLETAQASGLEGVVAKQVESRYLPGRRSNCWVKVKLVRHQEVVIAGWRPGAGRRHGGIGSLLLGVPHGTELRYVGHVGTGFTDAMLTELSELLAPLRQDRCPLRPPPPPAQARDAVWVRPKLVGEVAYGEWTPERRLRHPTWRGLRPDKRPEQVRLES